MESFDLLSALASILIKIAISYILLGLFTLIAVEAIATSFRLRSKYLKTILKRSFNNNSMVEALYNHPLIKILGTNANYIDKGIFSHALVDILEIDNAQEFLKKCREESKYRKNYFIQALYSLSKHATSVDEIREKASFLFIDFVSKVSNGYKFKIQKLILIIATILVVGLNIDSIKLFNAITNNTIAQNVVKILKEEKSFSDSTINIISNRSAVAYPVGWANETWPNSSLPLIIKFTGWLITIIFTCFSAQFLYSRYIAIGKPKSKTQKKKKE